jgi:uncharacterized protein (TIGR03067 family)
MYSTLLIGLALTVGAPAKDKKDAEKPSIVGVWSGEKNTRGGKEAPIPEGGVTITFAADGKVIVKEGERERDSATYKVDAKKDPAEIDLIPPKEEVTMRGIYRIDGDTLTICFSGKEAGGKNESVRPTKFESPEGSMMMLITLKRVKK